MGRLFDLKESGYFYSRLQNPTCDTAAAKIAALEGGVAAMLTSSGQAASFYSVFNICECGDHFIATNGIYGGTFNLFVVTMKKIGYRVHVWSISMRATKNCALPSAPTPNWCSANRFRTPADAFATSSASLVWHMSRVSP